MDNQSAQKVFECVVHRVSFRRQEDRCDKSKQWCFFFNLKNDNKIHPIIKFYTQLFTHTHTLIQNTYLFVKNHSDESPLLSLNFRYFHRHFRYRYVPVLVTAITRTGTGHSNGTYRYRSQHWYVPVQVTAIALALASMPTRMVL